MSAPEKIPLSRALTAAFEVSITVGERVAVVQLPGAGGYVACDLLNLPRRAKIVGYVDASVGVMKCKYCGCSEFNACMTAFGGCAWVSRRPPVCSAAACLKQWEKEQRGRVQRQGRAGTRRPKTRAPRAARRRVTRRK